MTATLDRSNRIGSANESSPSPTAKAYTRYNETRAGRPQRHNHQRWPNGTRTIRISGKHVIFDAADTQNLLKRFNGHEDVRRLYIYAERLDIKKKIDLPACEVHIHVKDLRFVGGRDVVLSTQPRAKSGRARQFHNGADGLNAGDIYAYFDTSHSQSIALGDRFHQQGGAGQDAGLGQDGKPGNNAALWFDTAKNSHQMSFCKSAKWTAPVHGAARLSRHEIKTQIIPNSADWPTNGENARPGGRPGRGGWQGNLFAIKGGPRLKPSSGGRAGKRAPNYNGGKAGKPNPAIKVKKIVCDRDYRYYTSNPQRDGWSSEEYYYPPIFLVYWPWERKVFRNGANVESPKAAKNIKVGGTHYVNGNMRWYHPHAAEMALAYARDAFRGGHHELARQELTTHLRRVDDVRSDKFRWKELRSEDRLWFMQQAQKMRVLLQRLESGQDYYGNPAGWVPALSLEANKLLFEEESEWAIRTLFVAEWLRDQNNRQRAKTAAIGEAEVTLRQEIGRLEQSSKEATDRLPGLKSEAAQLQVRIEDLSEALQVEEERLRERAEQNIEDRHKVPLWKKGLRVLGGVLQTIPTPITKGLGAGLDVIANFDSDKPWGTIFAVPDVIKHFAASDTDAKARKLEQEKAKQRLDTKKDKRSFMDAWRQIETVMSPIVSELMKARELLEATQVPQTEVQVELERLREADPIFRDLATKVERLLADKTALAEKITNTLDTLEQTTSKIGEHYLAIAELAEEVSSAADAVLGQKAHFVLAEMRRRARDRLRKYQYGLAKAYEYRTLKPYPGDLTLDNVFDELARLAKESRDGRHDTRELGKLTALYRSELARVVEEIHREYLNTVAPRTISATYHLSAKQLEVLNQGKRLTFDLWEEGLFGAKEEDVRIVKLEVVRLEPKVSGQPQGFGRMDLMFEHEGVSRFWHNGRVHAFRHYHPSTAHPMEWTSRYELDGSIVNAQLSASSKSLLRALLKDDDVDMMLFSRPSAWARLSVTKSVTSGGDLKVDLNAMTVRITYDYRPASGNVSWSKYRSRQDAEIRKLYDELQGRAPNSEEQSAARRLLDVGYDRASLRAVVGRDSVNAGETTPAWEDLTSRIDAVFWRDIDATIYFFGNRYYIRITKVGTGIDAGYPKPIAGNWPGLPEAFTQGIDAALWRGDMGKIYLFKGDQYVRFSKVSQGVDPGYPKPIAGNWPGLPEAFTHGIDAALWRYDMGKIYLFKGDQYVRFSKVSQGVDPGYPKPIAGNWRGLPEAFTQGIDAALMRKDNGKIYFFKGTRYVRYSKVSAGIDPGYPALIHGNWMPFPK